MPETVTFAPDDEYILVNSVGEVYVHEWENSIREILAFRDAHGIDKVMVDSTKQTKTSSEESIFDFAQQCPRDVYFALLVEDATRDPKSTEPMQRFLESIGQQFGVKMRSFTVRSEAEAWLREQG